MPRPLLINQLPVFLRKWEHRIRTTTPSTKKKKKINFTCLGTHVACRPPPATGPCSLCCPRQPARRSSVLSGLRFCRSPSPTRSHSCTSVTASRCFALQHQSCLCPLPPRPQRPPLPASGHATGRPPPFTHRDASRLATQSLRLATPGDGSSSSSDLRSQQLWPAESPGLSLLGSGGMGSCGPRSSCHTPLPPKPPAPALAGTPGSPPFEACTSPVLHLDPGPSPAQGCWGPAAPAPGAPLPQPSLGWPWAGAAPRPRELHVSTALYRHP